MTTIKYRPIPLLSEDQIRIFYSHIIQSTPDLCWQWKKGKSGGYGMFYCKQTKTNFSSCRIAYFLYYKIDPGILLVCHHCDNPTCCNPNHLFLGTNLDNINDMISKNRHAKGPTHMSKTCPEKLARGNRSGARTHPEKIPRGNKHWSRLNPEKVARGNRHGTKTHPECIKRGDRSFSHLHPERLSRGDRHYKKLYPEKVLRGNNHPNRLHPENLPRGNNHHNSKLTDSVIKEIRILRSSGNLSIKQIAIMFGVSKGTISDILRYRTWKHVT